MLRCNVINVQLVNLLFLEVITVNRGAYIPGGTQIPGNYQGINDCMKVTKPELFASFFHLFEAGIASAISSFKLMKKKFFYEK